MRILFAFLLIVTLARLALADEAPPPYDCGCGYESGNPLIYECTGDKSALPLRLAALVGTRHLCRSLPPNRRVPQQ